VKNNRAVLLILRSEPQFHQKSSYLIVFINSLNNYFKKMRILHCLNTTR